MLVGIEDQVFLPADFIICRGDIGNEMYFLREGFAGVFTCHFAKKRGGTSFTWSDPRVFTVILISKSNRSAS